MKAKIEPYNPYIPNDARAEYLNPFPPSLVLPSNMISSPVPASLTGFTAYYAHKRALKSAALYVKQHPEVKETCATCNDTKKITIRMTTYGETTEHSVSEIDCIHCIHGSPSKLKQTYDRLVWCNCRHRHISGFIKAEDGSRVFGNTTYLCSKCGFVKQFG